jgi:hypothetical protein
MTVIYLTKRAGVEHCVEFLKKGSGSDDHRHMGVQGGNYDALGERSKYVLTLYILLWFLNRRSERNNIVLFVAYSVLKSDVSKDFTCLMYISNVKKKIPIQSYI